MTTTQNHLGDTKSAVFVDAKTEKKDAFPDKNISVDKVLVLHSLHELFEAWTVIGWTEISNIFIGVSKSYRFGTT